MASTEAVPRHHECALCMERFTSPRLLPCFHSFCLGCLQRLVQAQPKSRMFPCPTCRTSITVPAGGVEKFQVNFYIEAEVESQQAGAGTRVRQCDMCGKNPATRKCTDCDQFACDTCAAIHGSIAATKSHTVLQLTNSKGSGHSLVKVTKERYCSTHKDEKIRFFCNQCTTVICRDCKLTSHEGHNTTDLSAKSSQARTLILKVTEQSRKTLEPKLRECLSEADHHKKNIQDKKKEILTLLKTRAGELKEEIDKSLAWAEKQLQQETDNVDKMATKCIDTMNHELACFLSLTEHAERVVRSGCDADILEMPTKMKEFFGGKGLSTQPQSRQGHQWQGIRPSIPCSSDFEQSGNLSACKLKSFLNTKWKVTVEIDGLAQCACCSHQYNRSIRVCPQCGTQNQNQKGNLVKVVRNNSYLGGCVAGNVQCSQCGRQYANQFVNCQYCGATNSNSHEDAKATIKQAIPHYIGCVTKSDANEDGNINKFNEEYYEAMDMYEDNEDFYDTTLYAPSRGYYQATGVHRQQQKPAQKSCKKKKSLSKKIAAEVFAIQFCLSQWQSWPSTQSI